LKQPVAWPLGDVGEALELGRGVEEHAAGNEKKLGVVQGGLGWGGDVAEVAAGVVEGLSFGCRRGN
jgi:hypothetical protein